MKYKIIIRPEAESDLKSAFDWYEDQREGLGFDFLFQVDEGIKFIENNPKVLSQEYKGTRKYIIKRFPYKIVYLVKNDKIIIIAVIHCKEVQI